VGFHATEPHVLAAKNPLVKYIVQNGKQQQGTFLFNVVDCISALGMAVPLVQEELNKLVNLLLLKHKARTD
jgi:hypothetical protein